MPLLRIRQQCLFLSLSLSGQIPGEASDDNVNPGAAAARAESGAAAAEARAEYANSVVAAAVARPYEEGGGGVGNAGGWTSNDNRGGYASVPPPRPAAPGRPSFDGRTNNGEESPKVKKGVFRRVFRRWRD